MMTHFLSIIIESVNIEFYIMESSNIYSLLSGFVSWHNYFEIHLCWCVYQYFIPFYYRQIYLFPYSFNIIIYVYQSLFIHSHVNSYLRYFQFLFLLIKLL